MAFTMLKNGKQMCENKYLISSYLQRIIGDSSAKISFTIEYNREYFDTPCSPRLTLLEEIKKT